MNCKQCGEETKESDEFCSMRCEYLFFTDYPEPVEKSFDPYDEYGVSREDFR